MELKDKELAGQFAEAVEGAIKKELEKITKAEYTAASLAAFLKLVEISKEFSGDTAPKRLNVQWVETWDSKHSSEE